MSEQDVNPCCFRWAVRLSSVADTTLDRLLGLVTEGEQAEVRFYRQPEDQKRALVSRLLQRACISRALGIAWEQVVIERTRGRKPFASPAHPRPAHAPNFNYNVSHEVCVCSGCMRRLAQCTQTLHGSLHLPSRIAAARMQGHVVGRNSMMAMAGRPEGDIAIGTLCLALSGI